MRLRRADGLAFARALKKLSRIEGAALAEAIALLRVQTLARGEAFLSAGDRARNVAVVESGLLREFFLMPDGTERTKAFVREDELSGSLADRVKPVCVSHERTCIRIGRVDPLEPLLTDTAPRRERAKKGEQNRRSGTRGRQEPALHPDTLASARRSSLNPG